MSNIKKYLTIVIILLLFLSLSASVTVAIEWPIKPHNTAHALSSTYGDARSGGSIFHMAVDIPASDGTDVYCIKEGYVIAKGGDWIQIGDAKTSTQGWSYTHMDNIPAAYLVIGTKVPYHAVIGKIKAFYGNCDHLDFRLDSKDATKAFVNPVKVLNPSPPKGGDPVVSEILFRKQEEGAWFKKTVNGKIVIYDKVDIIAKAKNNMGSIPSQFSSDSPGIYKIEYKVTGPQNIPICVLTTFTGQLTKSDGYKIYDGDKTKTGVTNAEYYYTVTNTKYDTNQHWYTKSKSAGTSGYNNGVGGAEAKTNKEAYFKDGEYTVKVKAYGWHGDIGEKTVNVLVDNFYPTVESTTPTKDATYVPLDTNIVVTFDEKMDTDSVESAFSINPSISGTFTWSNNDKTLTFNPSSDLEKGTAYTVTVDTGAKDMVGKGIDGDSDGDAGPAYSWSFGPPPDIWVNPESFYIRLQRGDITNRILTVGNNGTGVLVFNITDDVKSCGEIGLISQDTQLESITCILDEIEVDYDVLNYDGHNGNYTSNLTTLTKYSTVIYYNYDFAITQGQHDALEEYLQNGGNLLVTGYDHLGSPNDPSLADIVRSSDYGDETGQHSFTVTNGSHPIMNGPHGNYPTGISFILKKTDHDKVEADTARGAVTVALLPSGYDKIIATELASGGKVVDWNGNRNCHDWTGDTDLANMLKNTLDWFRVEGYDWLSEYPISGTVSVINQTNIVVTINATILEEGEHNATIIIESNDPDEGIVNIPVNLTAIPPDHDIAVTRIEAPNSTEINSIIFVNGTVCNIGVNDEYDIVVDFIVDGSLEDNTTISLTYGNCTNVSFTWTTPSIAGEHNLTIYAEPVINETIVWNNMISQNISVVTIPDICVEPESIKVVLSRGDITNRTLTIGNNGTGLLVFNTSDTSQSGRELFNDTFPLTTINTSNWVSTTGSPVINTLGINEPSPPYSLELDGSGDTITSKVIDLSAFSNVTLSFYYELGGGGETPDSDDWLSVDYYSANLSWKNVWSKNGDGRKHNTFNFTCISLPSDALHFNFQLRFRSKGSGSSYDEFYVDDVEMISGGANWISIYPINGTVNPDNCTDINVTINTTGLEAFGRYNANITIENNDPNENPVSVPVHLIVTQPNPPDIWVNPTEFDKTLPRNTTWNGTMTIGNSGSGVLHFNISDVEQQATAIITSEEAITGLKPMEGEIDEDGNSYVKVAQQQKGISLATGDIIKSVPVPGTSPTGLTWDSQYLWLGDWWTDKIYKLSSMDGSIIKSFSVPGSSCNGLAWDGQYLWVSDSSEQRIYKISTTGSVITSFSAPGGINGWGKGLTWDGQCLWHIDYQTDTIYKLNPSNGSVITSFSSPANNPQGMAWDGQYLWHSDSGTDMIYKLDPSDGSVITSFSAPGSEIGDLAWGRQYLWCNEESTLKIYQIDVGGDVTVGLCVSPTSGTVDPGSQTNINVTINTTGLLTGEYNANITITSNDLDERVVVVPVHVTVNHIPAFSSYHQPINISVNLSVPPYPLPLNLSNITNIEKINAEF